VIAKAATANHSTQSCVDLKTRKMTKTREIKNKQMKKKGVGGGVVWQTVVEGR